jgi:hypothetical protein
MRLRVTGKRHRFMARPLRVDERNVILEMLKASPSRERLANGLDAALVEDMDDGGMGSIKFVYSGNSERNMSFELASAEYRDEDGVPVSIALNMDQFGDLFELDFWKVDFSPLLRYPRVEQVKTKSSLSG